MKTKFFSCLLGLAVWAAPAPLRAQTTPAPPTPTPGAAYIQMGTHFFEGLEKGEVGVAFDDLTHNSELATKTVELDALKTKTRKAMDLIGGVRGAELLKVEKTGSRLVRLTYVSYGDKYPLRWLLYFYEVEKVWRLIDLRVDDSLVRMFGDQETSAP